MEIKNMKVTELCLGLPGVSEMNKLLSAAGSKRMFAETEESQNDDLKLPLPSSSIKPPPEKARAVGWPPVRAHRQNVMRAQKNTALTVPEETTISCSLIKVSIDGAPYLRKVDLKMYKSYQELSDALAKLFSSFTKGCDGDVGMIDFMNESKLRDAFNCSDLAKTYQDKDGDWMLVGDVPWEMFVKSCKRLRIMKGSEGTGLALRPVDSSK